MIRKVDMRSLMVSTLISAGALVYLSSAGNPMVKGMLAAPTAQKAREWPNLNDALPAENSIEQAAHPQERQIARAKTAPVVQEPERMVQIYGKWYKYRPDNRYVIDGVTTLHIPKKIEMRSTEPVVQTKYPAAKNGNAAPEKLMDMAAANPLKVYTPEGFRTLQEGLEAAKSSAEKNKKALEQLDREP